MLATVAHRRACNHVGAKTYQECYRPILEQRISNANDLFYIEGRFSTGVLTSSINESILKAKINGSGKVDVRQQNCMRQKLLGKKVVIVTVDVTLKDKMGCTLPTTISLL